MQALRSRGYYSVTERPPTVEERALDLCDFKVCHPASPVLCSFCSRAIPQIRAAVAEALREQRSSLIGEVLSAIWPERSDKIHPTWREWEAARDRIRALDAREKATDSADRSTPPDDPRPA